MTIRPKAAAKETAIGLIRVRPRPGDRTKGWMTVGPQAIPVALGRSGIKANKFEGDGASPRGRFRPIRLWWRADRAPAPQTRLPLRPIRPDDAWCEEPTDRRYNQAIRRQKGQSGDRLWRADRLYDLIVEIDHNKRPRIAGRGSAVFIHVARPGFRPTAGCIALSAGRLRWLVGRLGPKTRIEVH